MTYDQAIAFLYGLRLFGVKLGLENAFKLAALAGEPQRHLRFIHVAGTNGKGSTCAMLEAVYRASGLRVGLFTSPHLVSFSERIQVDRQPIPAADVARLVAGLQPLLAAFPHGAHPTFFEVVTVLALRWFAEQRCELVIWETGLGGRLDATNIVTPLASVITNIQWDHQQWLGDSLRRIAAEKAGIIKPGVPALTAADAPEALEVIRGVAERQGAPLRVVTATDTVDLLPADLRLPLLGDHQRLNATLAAATVGTLRAQLPVPPDVLRRGLETVHWPGRFQVVRRGGVTLVLDGAHNPGGAEALREALQRQFPDQSPTLVLGVLADKDWLHICAALAPAARRVVLVPVQSERTAQPADLFPAVRAAHPGVSVLVCGSLAEALEATRADPLVVLAGSLYLIGEALEQLGLAPAPPNGGRGLNEQFTAPPSG